MTALYRGINVENRADGEATVSFPLSYGTYAPGGALGVEERAHPLRLAGLAGIDPLRIGRDRAEPAAVLPACCFTAIHAASSCAFDRYFRLRMRKEVRAHPEPGRPGSW